MADSNPAVLTVTVAAAAETFFRLRESGDRQLRETGDSQLLEAEA